MTPEQIDLLPCPFCGGKAHMASEHDADTGGKFYFIKCASCRAKGQESYARETCPIFFGQVRDAWNRRASPVNTALAEDAARAHDLALEVERLRAENADLKTSVTAFCAPWAAQIAKDHGLPDGHLFAGHYDILKNAGARMVDFTRYDPDGIPEGE